MRKIKGNKKNKEESQVNIKKEEKLSNINVNNSNKTITWRCSEFLIEKAKNSLISRQNSGDYSITNFSDLIRQSLIAYQQGMPLTNQRQHGEKTKEISVRLDNNLYNFYNTLPKGSRVAILERVLASYLNNI